MKENTSNTSFWSAVTIFLLCILCFYLSSCNPQRRMERATQTVLMNPEARQRIYAAQAALTPCANDTVIQWSRDTLITTDTTVTRDTIDNFYHYTDTIKIVQTKRIHDTAKIVVIDHRLAETLADTVSAYKWRLATSNGRIDELQAQVKKERRTLVYGALGLLIIGVGIGILIKFKL